MKKLFLVALLLCPTVSLFSAAKTPFDFVAGEKIAQALEKILEIYKPQSMLDSPIIAKIKEALNDANTGKAALAKNKIRFILTEYASRLENYPQNDMPSLVVMLKKAAIGRDPY